MRRYITAEDLYFYSSCDRKVYLAHHGDPTLRQPLSDFQSWLMERGRAHETDVAGELGAERAIYPPGDLETGFAVTLQAMREGRDAIYQGVLAHQNMAGIPDLLIRVDEPSALGDWHYRPLDIKLGTSVKREHTRQVVMYLHLLEQIQGVRPAGSIVLEDKSEQEIAFDEHDFSEALHAVLDLAEGQEAQPFISSACRDCRWRKHCLEIAEEAQDISLISGLRRVSWEALRSQGLSTLPVLAAADSTQLMGVPGIGAKTAYRLPLQARALVDDEMYVLQQPSLQSSHVEVYFDVESVPPLGLYYLMGMVIREGDRTHFVYDLAWNQEEEGEMWRSFLDRVDAIDGVVYHYASYERQTVRKLDERYGPDPRAEELLARMVDVRSAMADSVVLPLRGTSLKEVAPWLGFEWKGDTTAADDSMMEYLRFLEDSEESHLENILVYNEDDCHATLLIRDWLEDLSAGQ